MNQRDTKTIRDRLIRYSRPDGYLTSVYSEAAGLMREAALMIEHLRQEVERWRKATGRKTP